MREREGRLEMRGDEGDDESDEEQSAQRRA